MHFDISNWRITIMVDTSIEWSDKSWNPVTGCNKVSPGCKNCYAERIAKDLFEHGVKKYANNFQVTLHPHELNNSLNFRTPQNIFVNSMSDLFHKDVPDEFIDSDSGPVGTGTETLS